MDGNAYVIDPHSVTMHQAVETGAAHCVGQDGVEVEAGSAIYLRAVNGDTSVHVTIDWPVFMGLVMAATQLGWVANEH